MDDFHEKSGPHYNPLPTPIAARPPKSRLTDDEYRATMTLFGRDPSPNGRREALDDGELRATRMLMGSGPSQRIDANSIARSETIEIKSSVPEHD